MKFTPIPLSLPSIADEAGSERNPGLHISGVIKHLLMQMDPKKYGSDASDDVRVLWEMGLAWEEIALSRAFWERIMRRTYPNASFTQVQAQKDNIWGTCDMIALGDETVVTESKLTQISAINEIDSIKFWSWHVQMKAYCHMWGRRGQSSRSASSSETTAPNASCPVRGMSSSPRSSLWRTGT